MQPAAFVRSMLDALDRGDTAGYAAHYTPDGVSHDPMSPEPAKGREAITAGAAALVRAFPDLQCTVRSVIADGERIAAEVTFAGTNDGPLETPDGDLPPTGRPASLDLFVRLDCTPDGLVAESRGYCDVAALMTQLGLAP
jgi:predicted ester cyclase